MPVRAIVADHALLLLAALALDALLGSAALWRFAPHPVALLGRAIAGLDRTLNRTPGASRASRVRGAIVVALLLGAALAAGAGLSVALRHLPWGSLAEALIVAVLLAQRSLFEHVRAVAAALRTGGLVSGRAAVAHIVGRDPESLDEAGVARAAIESLAENFSDGVVAPAFWYLLLGLPGLFAYKTANTLDSMIGHRSPRHMHFGWAAARLDDLLNLLPARLSGLLLVAAGAAPGASASAAFRTMLRDAKRHRSPNAGWPEAAAAGALGLRLAGPRRYDGLVVEDAWLGAGRAEATPADIAAALRLYVAACLIAALLILGAALAL
jgi:adenosylcobinamide-phosphate synthase